ncbi:MAG: hypothetical protein FJ315_02670, partial [SAR202 cluster bacterium]|nr:hypothetical protein [SAR202 cluster bacterium]
MTQPSQNIQGNQGDVIGAGVAGSGNLLGKNITVQTVQGNVINLSLTPEVLNALDRVSQVPTEVQPKGPAGIQGNQVPQDLKGAEVAVNQLLDLLQRAGGRGQQPQVVQAGDVQVSKVDLLLKKAALLRMEAEQSVLDFVASNKDKLDEARERPGEVAKIVEQLDLNELMANFDPE